METYKQMSVARAIGRLVLVNTVIIGVICWLIVANIAPPYPMAPVGVILLLGIDYVVIWRAFCWQGANVDQPGKVPRLAWFAAFVFTIACLVELVYWSLKPDLRSTAQTIIGVSLAGYIWYLIHRLRGRKAPAK